MMCFYPTLKIFPIDKAYFIEYIIDMFLHEIHCLPIIERVINDAASVLGIAALLHTILKKQNQVATILLKKI